MARHDSTILHLHCLIPAVILFNEGKPNKDAQDREHRKPGQKPVLPHLFRRQFFLRSGDKKMVLPCLIQVSGKC